jgi:hypothetical protein
VVLAGDETARAQYEQAVKCVEALGPSDRLRLVAEVVARMSGELEGAPRRDLRRAERLGEGHMGRPGCG